MRIGFLLSGSGSTLENLINRMNDLKTPAQICVVVSSRSDAYGLVRAEKFGIHSHVVEYKDYSGKVQEYSDKITEILKKYNIDLVVMGGFMSFYTIPPEYENKVLNVHPALIPAFCGKNMYGMRVHKAVYESGVKTTGCTVHFVNNEYDAGPIIAQKCVSVNHSDTPESIAEKVVAAERDIYPEVIDCFVRGRVNKINGKFFIL